VSQSWSEGWQTRAGRQTRWRTTQRRTAAYETTVEFLSIKSHHSAHATFAAQRYTYLLSTTFSRGVGLGFRQATRLERATRLWAWYGKVLIIKTELSSKWLHWQTGECDPLRDGVGWKGVEACARKVSSKLHRLRRVVERWTKATDGVLDRRSVDECRRPPRDVHWCRADRGH